MQWLTLTRQSGPDGPVADDGKRADSVIEVAWKAARPLGEGVWGRGRLGKPRRGHGFQRLRDLVGPCGAVAGRRGVLRASAGRLFF